MRSYYYIYSMRREGFIARMQEQYPDVEWFLDSGAFTYWAKYEKEPEKLPPWKKYKKLFFTYVNDTWERWARIAELDLDHVEGIDLDMLAEWRDEMFDRWPQANICPVWHPSRGADEWTSYVRDPRIRHICIGSGQKNDGLIRRMVTTAHQWNKTVHGFGMTRVNTSLQRIPYDSVDSTSWLMSQKFGTMFIFKDNKFRLIGKDAGMSKKQSRMPWRNHFKRLGLDWRKIEADDVAECRKASIIAWRRLSDRLQEIRKRQGRSLYGEERPQGVNLEVFRDPPRPRDTDEVKKEGHGWAKPREPRDSGTGGAAS